MKNQGHLHSVVWITLLTLLTLLLLSWLPDVRIGSWQMRRIDVLAELRSDSLSGQAPEQMEQLTNVQQQAQTATQRHFAIDTCRAGITCINDMADEQERGMTPLYQALENINDLGRPVRIAVLGDSYIEGDILTANLRQLLQQRYGGCGVGFVPATCDAPGFRRSVRQTFNGTWTAHNANDKSGYDCRWANLTGHYFIARSGAWVELSGVNGYLSGLDTCSSSTLYFLGYGTGRATAVVNGAATQQFALDPAGRAAAVTVDGRIGRVRWTVDDPGDITFLGASMDCDRGVLVDNLAMRAASGLHLSAISEVMLSDLDHVRHYDLVIIMYGLNVAGRSKSDYAAYRDRMVQAIDRMKRNMPQTGFLVVSVGDREEKRGGTFRTMHGVISMVNAQQRIAYDSRVAFWNLFTAMGGEGSIVRMVEQKQANLDYTHINFRGGAQLAQMLFDAITWGHEQYHRQMQKGGQP